MGSYPGGHGDQRMANVVAVAYIRHLQAAGAPESLLQCEEIGNCLAGMVAVGERVDYRDVRMLRQFVERGL